MNARQLALVVMPVSLLVVYACSSDSDDTNANVNLDAGPPTGIGTDTGVGTNEDSGSPVDAGGQTVDSGPPKGPITTCTPISPLSTKRGGLPFNVGSFNGKYLFTYGLQYTESPDGLSHLLGRYFDGTSLGPEIDFGTDGQVFDNSSVDGTGKEFIVHVHTGGALQRIVFDLTTGTQLFTIDGAGFRGDTLNFAVGGLPQGALAAYGSFTPKGAIVSHYGTDGFWDENDGGNPPDAGDGGFYPESNNPDEAGAAFSASGKGALWWVSSQGGANEQLTVLPFDGTKFGLPINRAYTANENGFAAAALSNGDVVFTWLKETATSTALAIFHAGTGQFDADIPLGATWDFGEGYPTVVVDANDNINALWLDKGGYKIRRRLAGTWTSDIPISKPSTNAYAVVDPAGNLVIPAFVNGAVFVTRMSPNDTTVGTFTDTGLSGNALKPPVAFNAAGDPVIMAYGQGADGILNTTTCSSTP